MAGRSTAQTHQTPSEGPTVRLVTDTMVAEESLSDRLLELQTEAGRQALEVSSEEWRRIVRETCVRLRQLRDLQTSGEAGSEEPVHVTEEDLTFESSSGRPPVYGHLTAEQEAELVELLREDRIPGIDLARRFNVARPVLVQVRKRNGLPPGRSGPKRPKKESSTTSGGKLPPTAT